MVVDWDVIFNLMGSLGIFLFAMEYLSSNLRKLSLETLKKWLFNASKTPLRGLVSGTIATTLLDSSSVVIILLIAFVDSHLITFANAIGIVLGANIGTTISSQLIAFRIGDYAAIPLFLSVITSFMVRSERVKTICHIVTGISLIFFSLHLMDLAVYPYRNSPALQEWMMVLNNPLHGALVGGLMTLIIQSSSATVGIAITMAAQGLISLDAGIAIMLGAEIGTCSDTVIATIGRSREAIRIGLFHLFYNVFTVILGLITFSWLKDGTLLISGEASVARAIANAHLIFNVGGALFFLLLIPWCRKVLMQILPSQPSTYPQVQNSRNQVLAK